MLGDKWGTLLGGALGGNAFGEVIPMVFFAWAPDYLTLPLLGVVSEPVKIHVDCFGLSMFDGVIKNSFSTFVVSSEHCGRLGVAQFDEGLLVGAAVLGIHECSNNMPLHRCNLAHPQHLTMLPTGAFRSTHPYNKMSARAVSRELLYGHRTPRPSVSRVV
jgi:hypothetical protein